MVNEAQSKKTKLKIIRIVLLGILGVVLTYLVVTRSLTAFMAEAGPTTAPILVRAYNTGTLVELADSQLNAELTHDPKEASDVSPKNSEVTQFSDQQIREWMKLALLDEPLNPRAQRILGQLAEKNDDAGLAEKYMLSAAKLSIRDDLASFRMMQLAYGKQDYDAVLKYADILLWRRPVFAKHITPVLATLADNDNTRPKVDALLLRGPSWRMAFFQHLPASITNIQTPLKLLLKLKEGQTPPRDREILYYLNFLLKNRLYDQAYYSWLQFLTPEQLTKAGFLFNGSFELALDLMPFNWTVPWNTGVTIDTPARFDNASQKALRVTFSEDRVKNILLLSQFVVLAPGGYILEGRHKGELTGSRGLRWRILCYAQDGRRRSLGKGPMLIGKIPKWQKHEFDFVIPDRDCGAQRIELHLDARTLSERLISGSVWYDDIKITPKSIEQ